MGISCQRNGHALGSDQLSVNYLVQPIKELSAAGRCAGRGCALIRHLANICILIHTNVATKQESK